MSYSPVSDNQYFLKVGNTVVTPLTVKQAQEEGRLSLKQEVRGTVTPTTAGDYAVKDLHSIPIQLPVGAVVESVLFGSTPIGSVVGAGATFTLGTASAAGGAIVQALTAAVDIADLNLNVTTPSLVATGILNSYLTLETSADVTAGTVNVSVTFSTITPI